MLTIASVALAVLATARPVTDTTITVKPGTRLVVDNFAGAIAVDTWNRDAIRVRAEHSRRATLEIESDALRLDLSAHGKWGEPVWVDYVITVPHETPVELSGIDTDIALTGRLGVVKAETVKGDVTVRGTEGQVSVSSVEGEVEVVGGGGRIEASAVNDQVRVVGVSGEVQAESVNGDVYLEDLTAHEVAASTVNGNVFYVGEIRKGGSYEFATHQGNLVIGMSEDSDVSGSVSTFEGSFSSTFTIDASEKRRGKEFHFTLGNGSARVSLEAFNGSIHLERPGEVTKRIAAERAQSEAHGRMKAAERELERKAKATEREIERKARELERKIEREAEAKAKKHQHEDVDENQDEDDDGGDDDGKER